MLSQMATLTVIPYKPPCSVIRKPPFKRVPQPSSVKNVPFDFPDMPIEELQPAGGTGWSNLPRETIGDNEPTTHDIQASKDILGRTQASIAEKHDSGDDTDDKLPPLQDIFPASYQRRQALREERLLRRSILEESNNRALRDDGSHKSRGSGSHDEPTVLDCDRSKDDDSNLDTGHEKWWDVEDNCFVDADLRPLPLLKQDGLASTPARYQPHSRHHSLGASQNQINLHDGGTRGSASKGLAPPSLSTIFDEDDGGRRDRNASLGKDSLLTCQLSPPQINPQQDQGGPSHSGFKELGQDQQDDEPKERQQQEVASEANGNKSKENGEDVDLRGEKRQNQDETEEIRGGIYHSEDGIHTHNTKNEDDKGPRPAKRQRKLRSEPIEALPPLRGHGISPTTPPTEPQLAVQAIDDNQDWEVHKIIGKEDVDGELHYLVDWSPTLVRENALGHAKELVDEFEARVLAKREIKNRQKGPGLKRRKCAVVKADGSVGQQQKRRRGRPGKQL